MEMSASSRRTWLGEHRPASPAQKKLILVCIKAPGEELWSFDEVGVAFQARVSCAGHSKLCYSLTPHRLQIPTHTLLGILAKFHLASSSTVGFHAGPCVFICEPDESLGSFKIFRLLDPEAYPSGLRSKSVGESRPILQLFFLV